MWDSDESLLRGMEQKSNQAYKIFYERYIDYVYRIVLGLVKNHDNALDLCQDLFLEYYNKAGTFDPKRGSVKAWVAVRARSRSVDFIRKRQKEVITDEVDKRVTTTIASTQETFLRKEESRKLVHTVSKLPDQERKAIIDHYVHSKTHREISDKVDRPLGSVKSSIRYGIQKLRKLYLTEEQYGNRGDSNEQSLNG